MEEQIKNHLQKALTLFYLKRYEECIAECKRILSMDVHHTGALQIIIVGMINLERPVKEIQKMAKLLLKEESNNSIAHFAMGHYYEERSQKEKAILHFETAIKHDPLNTLYLSRLAYAHRRGGNYQDYKKAEKLIEQILKLDPTNTAALTFKSMTETESLKFGAANKSIKTALELNPMSSIIHFQKGCIALGLMRPKEAEIHFKEAIKLNPHDEEIRRKLLDSQLAKWVPFNLLFSKYWIFNAAPDVTRALFIFWFVIMVMLFKTKAEPDGLISCLGFWISIIGFSIHFLQWFIAPAWRFYKSKKNWGVPPFPLISHSSYVLLSIQLAILATFYYFLTSDFRGATTAMFLSGYALTSLFPKAKEDDLQKKILTGILGLIYLAGFTNLMLEIFVPSGKPYKPLAGFAMTGWVILVFVSEVWDWMKVKLEGN